MELTRTIRCDASAVTKILQEVRKLGAQVDGDNLSGLLVGQTFLGRFAGRYDYDGERLTLVITEKPVAIPESLLADRLDDLARLHGLDS
ncbi:MAG: hypothetical protein O7A07_01675 [Acidobacteria bacterium]|nr:hypothetical protein [Acidobacteriota bacterium]